MPSSNQKSDPTKYVSLISFLWLGNTCNYILWFFNPILSARSSLHTSSCFKCEKKSLFFFTIMYPMTVVELICSGYRSTVFSEVQCLSSLCWRTTRWSNLSLRCRCQFYFPCIAVCKLLIYDLLSLFLPPPSIRRLWILNLCMLGVFHLDPVSYERSERSLIFISISYNRQFLPSQKIWPVSSIISL